MNQFIIKVLQVVLVFAAALAFYLLTAAYVPYPGVSTDYLTAICFPTSGGAIGTYMLDEWVTYHLIRFAGPGNMIGWTTVFGAGCGALLVSLLFLAVKSGVRLSCLDLTGIREHELVREEQDIVFISRVAGIGTAVLALVALPIWAMGTRSLPGALTACVGMAVLSLAIAVRRFSAEDVLNGAWPTISRHVMMGAVFGLATFIGLLSPMMLPVSLAGIILGGWVLVLPQIEGRLSYFPWIIGGVVLGVLGTIGVSMAWHSCFSEPGDLSPVLQWAQGLSGIAVTVMGMVMNFEGAAPLVFFAVSLALFIGCFPRAYAKFSAPIIGQFSILALVVLSFIQWPEDFWGLMSEPTPVLVLGMMMTLLIFGLMVGSWAKNWLDVHPQWRRAKAYSAVTIATSLFFVGVTAYQGIQNFQAGAGLSARAALSPIRDIMCDVLPENCRVWFAPPENASVFLVHRYADGSPVLPIVDIDKTYKQIVLKGKSFTACCLEDAVLAELELLGGAPLVQYLRYSAWGEEVISGSPASKHAAQVETVAALVAETPFGKTAVGEQFVETLSRQAAVAYAAQAMHCDDAAAEQVLRKAQMLDPENLGVRLSLGALEETGYSIPQQDRVAARTVVEENAWLRNPTLKELEAFELLYGPVRSETFRTATRLRKFLVHPDGNLGAIKAAYLKDSTKLSGREHVIALLALAEEETLASFEGREPTALELESYLCFHLRTPKAMEYYKRYETLLEKNDALGVLYHARGNLASDRLHEKAYAFFARDGHFPYAYIYVQGVLDDGDYKSAEKFVSGFSFREYLAERPCLMEELRIRVLDQVWEKDQDEAIRMARAWLHTEPKQPRIWEYLLTYATTLQPDVSLHRDDVRNCLLQYPSHAMASELFAEELKKSHGDVVAKRWTESVQNAQAEMDLGL